MLKLYACYLVFVDFVAQDIGIISLHFFSFHHPITWNILYSIR